MESEVTMAGCRLLPVSFRKRFHIIEKSGKTSVSPDWELSRQRIEAATRPKGSQGLLDPATSTRTCELDGWGFKKFYWNAAIPIHLLVSLNTSHSNRRHELLQQFYSRIFMPGLPSCFFFLWPSLLFGWGILS